MKPVGPARGETCLSWVQWHAGWPPATRNEGPRKVTNINDFSSEYGGLRPPETMIQAPNRHQKKNNDINGQVQHIGFEAITGLHGVGVRKPREAKSKAQVALKIATGIVVHSGKVDFLTQCHRVRFVS